MGVAATTVDNSELEDNWHNMLFGVRRSIRYHQRRRAFFERLDQFSNMLSVIFGSTAIYGVLGPDAKKFALIASAMVTATASINLVIGCSKKAREHSDLARRFIELEKRMIGKASVERLNEVTEARLNIEAEEPPILRVLDALCHNDQMRAMGYKREQLAKIGPLQTLFAQIFDWRPGAIH
ncbi:hypothetical protein [Azotobacter vinelandii]|uniref:hypothetical protein n=1 Tax=Azotobacter vinelandii TaxID=354 RepID=UPI0007748320|nr:hypothetical protein [Azotobacter vinelandii]WKN21516.1 hypothetical protein AVAEIV_004616 [Azotobacter vinelandii]